MKKINFKLKKISDGQSPRSEKTGYHLHRQSVKPQRQPKDKVTKSSQLTFVFYIFFP